jgi:hypothetical protein
VLASGAITPGEAERIATGACRNSKTRPRRAPRPALQSRGRLAQQPIGECLVLICCRCSNVKQSVQFWIASRGHGHWQDGMLFAIIREGMAGDNHRGRHGAPA